MPFLVPESITTVPGGSVFAGKEATNHLAQAVFRPHTGLQNELVFKPKCQILVKMAVFPQTWHFYV